jgi:mRNA interferase MazF
MVRSFMRRSEIWRINLDPTVGSEINKSRPGVVVNRDALARLPLRIIVPITGWNDSFSGAPWHVYIEPTEENGLEKPSSADTFQVRSVSEKRLVEKIGRVSDEVMQAISHGLRLSMDLAPVVKDSLASRHFDEWIRKLSDKT